MNTLRYKFGSSSTELLFDAKFSDIKTVADKKKSVIITDENVLSAHRNKFKGWNVIVLKPGEQYKIQGTVDYVIDELIQMEADRSTTLIGVGGGVVTDITGYTASIYMRGIHFGFVPTSLLGMVDASIGGKNGVDAGDYKNLVGTVRQPSFLLYDSAFLRTLPEAEWSNGFAEIIKHASIKDAEMFRELESAKAYRPASSKISSLVRRNAGIKLRVVKSDEFEKGERRLLNFGHTIGHALEMQYEITHGQAISIGMVCACRLSATLNGFRDEARVSALLDKYGLPNKISFDPEKVFGRLKMDKKREQASMNFILLNRIGKASVKTIPLSELKSMIIDLVK